MLKFALRNLWSRPLRTSLSLLGLAVAIAGMVGLFSIAGGIDHMVSSTFAQIPGLLVQQEGAPIPLFSTLPTAWGSELEAIPGVRVVDAEVVTRLNVLDGETVINPPRFLVGLDLASRLQLQHDVYQDNMVQGRFLETSDAGQNRCVINESMAEQLQKKIGDRVSLNGYEFDIIGTYQTGSMMLDNNILLDLETARRLNRISVDTVSCFYVETEPGADQDAIKSRIQKQFEGRAPEAWQPSLGTQLATGQTSFLQLLKQLLSRLFEWVSGLTFNNQPAASANEAVGAWPGDFAARHSESATDSSDDSRLTERDGVTNTIEVRSADDWSERFDEFSGDLDLFLTLITGIGMLIAVLSITNTMMMSVTERTIEFGILRANGWSKGNVVRLIGIESAAIGLIGGLFGILFGWLATLILNWRFPDRLQLYAGPGLLLFGLAFSIVLGVVGGLYPAWSAARMSPMESIRRG